MTEKLPNNMQVSINTHGQKVLYIESSRIDHCMKFAGENSIGRIKISSFHGYDQKSISFLKDYIDQIIGVSFLDDYYDLTVLNSLTKLESLGIPPKFKGKVDLSKLPNITGLGFTWNPQKVTGLKSLSNLKSLTITNYKGSDLSEENFPAPNNLEELQLFLPKIFSLGGIERFQSLNKLEIWRSRNLKDISAIKHLADSLEKLALEKAKAVKDLDVLQFLKRCKELQISDLGSIPTLKFISEMKNLRFLSFVGTTIEDGDLSYCERLDFAGFLDKKHYSHKSKDFPDRSRKT